MYLRIVLTPTLEIDRLFLRTDSGEYTFTIQRIGILRDRWALVSGESRGQLPANEILHVRESLEDLLTISTDYIQVEKDAAK